MRKSTKIILAIFVVGFVAMLTVPLVFGLFAYTPYEVKGTSMMPTYADGDYLVVNKFAYKFKKPKRGDLVIVKIPQPECTPDNSCPDYLKRIVGLPGETIEIKSGKVKIINDKNPNGFTLTEDYIKRGVPTLGNQTKILASGDYFLLGDNREPNGSSDSREWGPVKFEDILGKVDRKIR